MATQTIDIVARDKTKGVLGGIEKSLGRIGALAGAAFGVGALTTYANQIQTINNRLKLVTDGQADFNKTFKAVTQIARNSRQDLDSVSDLYQKIALSTKDLGLSQAAVGRTTESFTKLLSIAGAESGTAAGAIRQFAQALGSGAFRGDEFNSVVEAAPQILDLLAKELGVARGEVRALAADGKLTADVLVNTLLKSAQDIDEQFEKTSPTIGQALTTLKTNFLALGTAASPIFNAIAKAILVIANNLEAATVAATAFVAVMTAGKIITVARNVGNIKKAVGALTLVMRANPLVALATTAAAAGVAVYKLLGPILTLEGALGDKLLFALERAANSFLNFFTSTSKAAFEFGKLLLEAINPFDEVTLEQVYENFGSRMAEAYAAGFKENRVQFVSDEARDDFLAQLRKREEEILKGQKPEVPRIIITPESSAYTEEGFKILDIQEGLLNERQKIELEYSKRRILIEQATNHEIQASGVSREKQLAAIMEDRIKKLRPIEEQERQLAEQTRRDKLTKAMGLADELTRLELDKNEQIREINLLTEDVLTQAGIDRATAIRNVEKKFELEREAALKRQAELAKALAFEEAVAKLRAEGHSAKEADDIAKAQVKNMKDYEEDKVGFTISSLAKSMKAIGQHNRQAFEASKALAVAEAIMNTYSMAVAAFKSLAVIPVIGPALGAAAAAAAIATGFAQVSAIRSQQYTGPREQGGPVGAGQSYLVGEKGPEMFVPNAGGQIVSNANMGAPVNVNFNIETVDASGFDDLLIDRRGTIVGIINQAMEKRGRVGVV